MIFKVIVPHLLKHVQNRLELQQAMKSLQEMAEAQKDISRLGSL